MTFNNEFYYCIIYQKWEGGPKIAPLRRRRTLKPGGSGAPAQTFKNPAKRRTALVNNLRRCRIMTIYFQYFFSYEC